MTKSKFSLSIKRYSKVISSLLPMGATPKDKEVLVYNLELDKYKKNSLKEGKILPEYIESFKFAIPALTKRVVSYWY